MVEPEFGLLITANAKKGINLHFVRWPVSPSTEIKNKNNWQVGTLAKEYRQQGDREQRTKIDDKI